MQNDLVVRLRARDPRAFRELFEAQQDDLRRVAARMTRETSTINDVVQDAWMQVFRNIDRFEERARLSTWLHRIVVNAALMHLRKERKLTPPSALGASIPAEMADDPWTTTRGVDEEVDERRLFERVRRSLERMPKTHREVLALAGEDLTMREMAERTGLSEPAIKTRLHRARRALRRNLAAA